MNFPERYRFTPHPDYASQTGDRFGWFLIDGPCGRKLACLACDGEETGWDHVSVSIQRKDHCPSWPEMAFVKSIFWDPEDCVIQYHPRESQYVNFHSGCLHLWRHCGPMPEPPAILVGPVTGQQTTSP